VGESTILTATVRDGAGDPVQTPLFWSSDAPAIASVDASSGVVTAVAAGVTRVRARSGDAEGSSTVEVYLAEAWDFRVGASAFGRNDYIEYIVGDLPLVIAAPHGGYEEPGEVGRRRFGVLGQDRMTQEAARAIADEIFVRVGRRPHLVINRLHRNRLDANREIVEAAQGDPFAEQAWIEFNELVDSAKARVVAADGIGLFVDLHGHGHEIQRVELGYLLSGDDLGRSNEALDAGSFSDRTSIRRLAGSVSIPLSQLLRGPQSMGGLLGDAGIRAIPSPSDPAPLGAAYFSGGYNTRKHGSATGGPLDGIQFELHWSGLRDTEAGRAQFAQAFASAVQRYTEDHFGLLWSAPAP